MADGDEAKEFIMGNEDVLKKLMTYMVSIIELYKFLTNIDEFIDNKHCHTQRAQWMDFNVIFFTGYKFILFCNICINYQLMFVTRR